MTICNKFLCRITPAGVPHTLPVNYKFSEAILQDIQPEDICKIFWLIESLNISYTYELNGVAIDRSFTAETTKLPVERVISPALIYKNGTDDYTGSDFHVLLDFSKIYYNAEKKNQYGLRIAFEESDAYYLFNIGFVRKNDMDTVSCNTTFLGCNLTIFLNYDQFKIKSASISNFVINANFFTPN